VRAGLCVCVCVCVHVYVEMEMGKGCLCVFACGGRTFHLPPVPKH
jgi:hypothetical protein